ncbi:hypothetical protein KQI84_18935 [bacterium]|nr:hypothetical protein [bacterium]
MMIRPRKDRGSLMLGFIPLVILLGTMCAIISMRSFDAYRASAMTEVRLQARAAAEGAVATAIAVAPGAPKDFTIGRCRVNYQATSDSDLLPLTVEVLGSEDSLIAGFAYEAVLESKEDGSVRFVRLEKKS